LPEFDHEMAGFRRVLERIPQDAMEFRPHPKSFTLGGLGNHLATIPGWAVTTMTTTELDFADPANRAKMPPPCTTVAALLDTFDTGVVQARAALAEATDAALMEVWSGKSDGQVLFSFPRIGVLRSFILNHGIHHRGQATVYLRMLNVPVPALYGPTADEG